MILSQTNTATADPQSIDALIDDARALRYSDPLTAVTLATNAIAAADATRDTPRCIRALRTRGYCLARLSDLENARHDLDRADALLEDCPDDTERAWVLSARAYVLAGHGAHADAMRAAREALELHRRCGNRAGEGEVLNLSGMVADHLGDHVRSLELFHECCRIFEETNEDDGRCIAISNIATIHARLGDHPRAIEQLEEVLAMSQGSGHRWHESLILLNLGAAHLGAGHVDEALLHTNSCLRLARAIGDRRMEAQALTNLGEIDVRSGRAARACEQLANALALCANLGLRAIEIEIRLLFGEAHICLGDFVSAERHLSSAMEIAESIGSPFLHDIHRSLSDLYSRRGEDAKALVHYRRFHETKEAAWGAGLQMRMRAAMIEAEVEAAARVASELRARNSGLHAANEEKRQLLTTLAERTVELERLSFEDALTGVYNRRYLDTQLALEWERSKRYGHALSVAVLDVDHFKLVNDIHGHAAGDAVLRALATHLRRHTRRVDIVARYGGEEFAIVFVETSLATGTTLAEQVRGAVATMDYTAIATGLRITVSIGIAAIDEVTSPAELLARADARLYDAKRAGRNNVRSY